MENIQTETANLVTSGIPVPSESVNIVYSLQEQGRQDFLNTLGNQVCEDFDKDLKSRSGWAAQVADALALFMSIMPKKNTPWENASNVNLPMLAIACLQFHARAFDALIPSKEVVNVVDLSGKNSQRAARVKGYMNYQLLYKMEDFERGMDKTLMQLPIMGSAFKKTMPDDLTGEPVSKYVSANDIVVNYSANTTIEKLARKTHVLYFNENDVKKRAKSGFYISDAFNFGPGSYTSTLSELNDIREKANKAMGVTPSTDFTHNERIFLEQHCYVDIDGDGIGEPFVVTVDYETRKVVRITDRRYIDQFGKEQTIEYFTHYEFLPNPEGFYGLGFGILLSGLNNAGNTIVNEVIDAGSLANMQGGFINRRSGIKKGDLRFKLGEFKEVDVYAEDIQKSIFTFNFKGPNQTLYAVLGLLYEYSKLVSSVSETMTGQLPASDTPATTVMALIEEGRKVFSSIHKRIHRAFKQELRKIYRLNSIYLQPSEYFMTLNRYNIPEGNVLEILRNDFYNTFDVFPVSDPTITSRAEKVLKAQTAYQTALTSPVTAGNMQVARNAYIEYLKALEVENLELYLVPPPEIPDLSPQEENANFLQEKPATALPQQDHVAHLTKHDEFLSSAFAEKLTSQGQKYIEAHKQDHMAKMYIQSEIQKQQQANAEAIIAARTASLLKGTRS